MINLYELGKRYEAGEPDYYIKQFVNNNSSIKISNMANTEDADDNRLENEIISFEKLEPDQQSNLGNNDNKNNSQINTKIVVANESQKIE